MPGKAVVGASVKQDLLGVMVAMAFEQLLDQAEDKLGQGLEYFDVQLLFFLLVTFFFKGVITLFEHPVNSV